MAKYIFITGGVASSLGKGITTASIAALLQDSFRIKLRKMDPYLNVDPGTMNPKEHGEVFVTDDGGETDLDLGHYERFTGIPASKDDNITAGQLYMELLRKERRGDYLGKTVQVIPHLTDLIKAFITRDEASYDLILCEVGGTVGDIEALPFFEAIRQLIYERGIEDTLSVHLTLLPYLNAAKELKTKPTQHSVKELRSIGIQPNALICRTERMLTQQERRKIALFCSLPVERVIEGLDQSHLYNVPIAYAKQGLDAQILQHFKLSGKEARSEQHLAKWKTLSQRWKRRTQSLCVGIIGKYNDLEDAYKSLIEALDHAALANETQIKIDWVDAESLKAHHLRDRLSAWEAILVPGGFGLTGISGKLLAIEHARTQRIPFLGICLGMQLAVIEYARNVLQITDAVSTEWQASSGTPIIRLMENWQQSGKTTHPSDQLGGSMRLGAYPCQIEANTLAASIYNRSEISERHRHRYEFHYRMRDQFNDGDFRVSGYTPDQQLAEIIELKSHPWFIGCQFHPEFQSTPFAPHPLFHSFVKTAFALRSSLRRPEPGVLDSQMLPSYAKASSGKRI